MRKFNIYFKVTIAENGSNKSKNYQTFFGNEYGVPNEISFGEEKVSKIVENVQTHFVESFMTM